MNRPNPPGSPPEGTHFEAMVNTNWRVDLGAPCRRMGAGYVYCRKPSVAACSRGWGSRANWWAYCENHLYGNWIEDGQIMHWNLVADVPAVTP